MDDPKRLLATLNRSSLQRDNVAVYQVIKSILQGLGELQTKTSAMPATPAAVSPARASLEPGLTKTGAPPSNRNGNA